MEPKNPSHAALLKAIAHAGSQSALARLLGKSQPHVFKWLNSANGVPIEHCPAIERVTEGAVTRKELRPSDWHLIWPELVDVTEQIKARDDVQLPDGSADVKE